jgi:hypothetical protein
MVYVIFWRQIICNSGVSNVCSVGSLDTCKIIIVLAGSLGPKCWMTETTRILLAPCFWVPSSPSFPLFLLSGIMLHKYCLILVKTRTMQPLLCWSLGTKSLFWSTVALALLSQSSRTHHKWTLVSNLPFTLSLTRMAFCMNIYIYIYIYIYIPIVLTVTRIWCSFCYVKKIRNNRFPNSFAVCRIRSKATTWTSRRGGKCIENYKSRTRRISSVSWCCMETKSGSKRLCCWCFFAGKWRRNDSLRIQRCESPVVHMHDG